MKKKARVKTKNSKCLTVGCVKPGEHRGLCGSCYQCAYRQIKKGTHTWDELIKRGLATKDIRGNPGVLRCRIGKALSSQ